MGGVKQKMLDDAAKEQYALDIALESGALKTCEIHEDCPLPGTLDYEAAYKLGNSRFSKGELGSIFKTRREMTDILKQVIDEYSVVDECYCCAKNRDSD
jgi:hypothetical protein